MKRRFTREGIQDRGRGSSNIYFFLCALWFMIVNWGSLHNCAIIMNLRIKTEHNKEQTLKSPRANTPEGYVNQFNRTYDAPALKSFVRNYRKEIELPVKYETSIFMSKTPQRCLQHNNVITLYCINDKKPLCVHCMYQVFSHKKHEVVPLTKAGGILKEELKTTLKAIDSKVYPAIGGLINKNHVNLQRVQKEMGELMTTVTKFYNDLNTFINNKKNEHMKYYQQLWNRLRYQYSSFASELTKVNQYLNERLKEISERSAEEHLLFNHNVAINLAKIDQVASPHLCDYHELSIKGVYAKLEEVSNGVTGLFGFNYKIFSQSDSKRGKESSSSLKKEKDNWTNKKSQLVFRSSQRNATPTKTRSPRFSPNSVLTKSPFTPRQYNQHSPRKQMSPKFFHNTQSKDIHFQKTLKQEKDRPAKHTKDRRSQAIQLQSRE